MTISPFIHTRMIMASCKTNSINTRRLHCLVSALRTTRLRLATYFEHGYPQRAVAIHLVYPAEDGTLRLHHFVSVNNDDFANPQAKFFEVLDQLTQLGCRFISMRKQLEPVRS
jgi:hypothetical protein